MQIVPIAEIPRGEDIPIDPDKAMEIFAFCTKLEKMCRQLDGVGLAAVQVGRAMNVFVARETNKDPFRYYVNCHYEGVGQKNPSIEGCLSILDQEQKIRHFLVQRYCTIKLSGYTLEIGDDPSVQYFKFNKEITGFLAVVLQHEIDHAAEILISDHGQELFF